MNFSIPKALDIVIEKVEIWIENLISMLPNMMVAVLILVSFFLTARLVRLLTRKLVNRFSDRTAINNLIATISYLITIMTGLIISLNVLHLEQTVTSLLAGAGIVGLAIGFAFQDISANFISGILIAFRQPIKVGDIIETKGYLGMVEKIDMRVTVIKTFQGLHVIIPNKDVFQTPVTNYTKTKERRIDLDVGVSYAENLEKVMDITLKAVEKLPYLLDDKEVGFYYNEFGDSSINFTIMIWIHYPDEPGFLKARSDVIMAIKKAYDDNGITIPFPIRTLDFGVKGGKQLSQMNLKLSKNGYSKDLADA